MDVILPRTVGIQFAPENPGLPIKDSPHDRECVVLEPVAHSSESLPEIAANGYRDYREQARQECQHQHRSEDENDSHLTAPSVS